MQCSVPECSFPEGPANSAHVLTTVGSSSNCIPKRDRYICVCLCWMDVTSPCLHMSYSCGTRYGKPRLQGRVGSIACLHRRALARESPEERETRRRANADAMSEARARRIADCGWSHICPLVFRKYCCSRPNVHTKVAEASDASEATCIINTSRAHSTISCLTLRRSAIIYTSPHHTYMF